MKNQHTCNKHTYYSRSSADIRQRDELNHKLESLPRYTSGQMKDRCVYCAYLKGREDVLKELEKWIKHFEQ